MFDEKPFEEIIILEPFKMVCGVCVCVCVCVCGGGGGGGGG